MSERPGINLDFDDESDVDISLLAKGPTNKNKIVRDKDQLEEAAYKSGFTSRESKRPRRRGRRTAYTQQKNIKMRPSMPDLFVDLSVELGMKDYELLEHAIQLVIQKHKLKDELERFNEIIKEGSKV